MTRKDYVNITTSISVLMEGSHARRVYSCGDDHAAIYQAGIKDSARLLCKVFAEDNPRFDESRFLTACGVAK